MLLSLPGLQDERTIQKFTGYDLERLDEVETPIVDNLSGADIVADAVVWTAPDPPLKSPAVHPLGYVAATIPESIGASLNDGDDPAPFSLRQNAVFPLGRQIAGSEDCHF